MRGEHIKQLKLYLNEFKELTIKLIACLEQEKYEELENFFIAREEVITSINNLQFEVEIFRQICINMNIILMQQKLVKLMNDKKSSLKKEIETLEGGKIANKRYNKKLIYDPIYFNEKI
jgi:hypothetical protein